LTERHARALLRLDTEQDRIDAIECIAQESLNVAQAEEMIEQMLSRPVSKAAQKARRSYVIKDVRIFMNTIRHAVNVMRDSGVNADYGKEEDDRNIILTIKIPKKAS
jgi:ParB family chromosome partitioning protein